MTTRLTDEQIAEQERILARCDESGRGLLTAIAIGRALLSEVRASHSSTSGEGHPHKAFVPECPDCARAIWKAHRVVLAEVHRLRALSPVESPGEEAMEQFRIEEGIGAPAAAESTRADLAHAVREYLQAVDNAEVCPPSNECYADCHALVGIRRDELRRAFAAAPREVEEVRGVVEAARALARDVYGLAHGLVTQYVVECSAAKVERALARLSSPSGEAPERGDGEACVGACTCCACTAEGQCPRHQAEHSTCGEAGRHCDDDSHFVALCDCKAVRLAADETFVGCNRATFHSRGWCQAARPSPRGTGTEGGK